MKDIYLGDKTNIDGILDLMNSAANKENNPDYDFFIQGDLKQMAEQKRSLIIWGFDVKQNDVYPSIKKSDVNKALKLIWEFKIDGWWNYIEKYIELEICSQIEIDEWVDGEIVFKNE